MERVYLLLRNNQQIGPFTIGELLQQQLMPSDMIWIEGKSTAWTYLSELELVPFIKHSEAIPEPEKHTETEDEIERKAEELRQRILTAAPKSFLPNHAVEIESYASPYKLDDEIQFVDYRKEKIRKNNTVLGELLLTCFVIGLFMLGIYKGKSFLGARDKVQNSVATQLNSADQHAAQKTNTVAQGNTMVIDTIQQYDSLLAKQKPKQKFFKKLVDSTGTSSMQPVNTATVIQDEKKEQTNTSSSLPIPDEIIVKKESIVPKKEILPSVPEVKTNNDQGKEEKKGFFKGLFKKKKKEDADKAEGKG